VAIGDMVLDMAAIEAEDLDLACNFDPSLTVP